MQGGNVFYDLEIFPEHLQFMETEENFKAFEAAVLAKVGELEKILEEKATPASKLEDSARREYKENKQHKETLQENTKEMFDLLYEMGESLPFPVIYGMIDALRKLAQDLENSIHDRAKRESMSMSETVADKKMAQVQHKRIRDSWQPMRVLANLMWEYQAKQIASKPGNYATTITKNYAFFFPGEEEPFYNFRVVARRLGIFVEGIMYKDVLDYADEHPDEVEVKEVVL